MRRTNVLPSAAPLTEFDARELLSPALLRSCSAHGPKRVGVALGCDEKTVRNARDEKSTLRLDFVGNLLAIEPLALDPFLARVHRRSVPLADECDTDQDRTRQSKVLKAALALSEALEDDGEIDPEEVRVNRATIEDARNALDQLLARLVRAA